MSILAGFPKPILLPFYDISSSTYEIPDTLGIIHATGLTTDVLWSLPALSLLQAGAMLWIDNETNNTISLLPNGTDLINGEDAYICASQSITSIYTSLTGWHAASYLKSLGKSTTNAVYGLNSSQVASTGTGNTSFGNLTLANNNAGSNNTAVGYSALSSLTNGTDNTAVGSSSLISGNVFSGNTSVGTGSLSLCTGSYNTAVGYNSGNNLTTGGYNTLVGDLAGSGLSGGVSSNIIIGNVSGASTDNNLIRIGLSQTIAYIGGVTPVTQETVSNITSGTLSAVDFMGGIVIASGNFTLPTQSDLDANVPGITYNESSYVLKCLVINLDTATITLSAGTNTTLAYTITIPTNDSKLIYMRRVYDPSTLTASYTIY